MYLCGGGIDFAYFYDFSIRRWNFFDSVVFFVFHFNNKPKFNLYVVYLKKSFTERNINYFILK